jgi:hypothetical protein
LQEQRKRQNLLRFHVLTVASMNILSSEIKRHVACQKFTDVSEALTDSIIGIALMETVSTSETSVNFYQTTQDYLNSTRQSSSTTNLTNHSCHGEEIRTQDALNSEITTQRNSVQYSFLQLVHQTYCRESNGRLIKNYELRKEWSWSIKVPPQHVPVVTE